MKRSKSLRDVPDGVIICKGLRRHKLDHRGDKVVVGTVSRPKIIRRCWNCSECPVTASDLMDLRFHPPRRVNRRQYVRPESSKLPPGTSYDDVLEEYYIRTLNVDGYDEMHGTLAAYENGVL